MKQWNGFVRALVHGLTTLAVACTDNGGPVEPPDPPDPLDSLVVQLSVDLASYPDTAEFEVHSFVSGDPERCTASGDWDGEMSTKGTNTTTVGPHILYTEALFIAACRRGVEILVDTLRVAIDSVHLDPPTISAFFVIDSIISHGDSVDIRWNNIDSKKVIECEAFGSWSGVKNCGGGIEILGPFDGPDTLEFVYRACTFGRCAADTVFVRVKKPVVVGDFGVSLSICDTSTEVCYESDAQMPLPSGPFNNLVTGWNKRGTGFDMAAFTFFAEENAQNGSMGAMQFKISDPFIGASPMVNGVVEIENGFPAINVEFRRVLEGVLFSPDSAIYVSSCISMGTRAPDCQEQTLTGLENNDIQVKFVLKDRSGKIVEDFGILESDSCTYSDPCYTFEFRITGSRGLRSVYFGVATEECNLSTIGCWGQDEIFDRFGNEYIPGATYFQSGKFFLPYGNKLVVEVRAFDGVNPPVVERLHLNIVHR